MLIKKSPKHWSLIHSDLVNSPRRPKSRFVSVYKVDLEPPAKFAEESTVSFANRLCASPAQETVDSSIWIDAEGYISSSFVEKTIAKTIDRPHKISFLGRVSFICGGEVNMSLERITALFEPQNVALTFFNQSCLNK